MLEEIKVLQQIIGDLSGVGLWVVAIYVAYKISIVGAWLGVIVFITKKVYQYFSLDITRLEHVDIVKGLERKNDDIEVQLRRMAHQQDVLKTEHKNEISRLRSDHKNELERVQFMYSQLKKSISGEKEDK